MAFRATGVKERKCRRCDVVVIVATGTLSNLLLVHQLFMWAAIKIVTGVAVALSTYF